MGACRKIGGLLGAYVYGDLAPEDMRRVRLHVEECDGCRHDLASRSRAVALIPHETPKLTDEERLQVMWTVKGAVRSRQQAGAFGWFSPAFVRALAVAVVIAGAFAAGTIYGLWAKPARVIVMPPPKEVPGADLQSPDKTALEMLPVFERSWPNSTQDMVFDPTPRILNDPSLYRGRPGRNEESILLRMSPVTPQDSPKPWNWEDSLRGGRPYPSLLSPPVGPPAENLGGPADRTGGVPESDEPRSTPPGTASGRE